MGFEVLWQFQVVSETQKYFLIRSDQIRSVTQSCPTLCDPMNCSTPGLPVHHQLPESTQTHVHRVSDAIQPLHPLLSPSPAPNSSQHQSLFQWVNSSHEVAKVLEFQLKHQKVNMLMYFYIVFADVIQQTQYISLRPWLVGLLSELCGKWVMMEIFSSCKNNGRSNTATGASVYVAHFIPSIAWLCLIYFVPCEGATVFLSLLYRCENWAWRG